MGLHHDHDWFSSSPTLRIAITVAGLGIHRIRMGWVGRKQLKLRSRSTTVYIILLHSIDSYTALFVPQPQGHIAGVSLGIRSMENKPPRSQQAWAHWRVNFMDSIYGEYATTISTGLGPLASEFYGPNINSIKMQIIVTINAITISCLFEG